MFGQQQYTDDPCHSRGMRSRDPHEWGNPRGMAALVVVGAWWWWQEPSDSKRGAPADATSTVTKCHHAAPRILETANATSANSKGFL